MRAGAQPDREVPWPTRVGVVGGGRMGSGIAHAFITSGIAAVVVEADADRARAAQDSVRRAVDASVQRGTVADSAEKIMSRLHTALDVADLADCDLAIEAVPERIDLKLSVLASLQDVLGAEAVIASNTSSLSINEMAVGLDSPDRFIGMHFFNPVPASELVEVVVGAQTSEQTVDLVVGVARRIGKHAVVVHDSPGFASSRLGVALGLEAIRMVADGVAAPADIDAAMTLGYKHPVGPLKLTDIVGLDVRLGVAEYLQSTLGDRFAPPQLMRDMVARGDLGRKTGRGFYDWP